MIQRLIGILFTLATLAIIAFAILNKDNYRSLCFDNNSTDNTELSACATQDATTEAATTETLEEIATETAGSEENENGSENEGSKNSEGSDGSEGYDSSEVASELEEINEAEATTEE